MATGLPQSNFECSICFELLLDPVVLSCGHDACKSCLDTWKATQVSTQPLRCPLCRGGALPDNPGVCLRLRDTIEALFPDKVAARRREVAKAAERRKQQQQQARASRPPTQQAALRGALQALVDHAAVMLAQPRAQQPPPAAPLAPPAEFAFDMFNPPVFPREFPGSRAGNPTTIGFFPLREQEVRAGDGGGSASHRAPNPVANPPVARTAAGNGFGFSFPTLAGGLGQQAAGSSGSRQPNPAAAPPVARTAAGNGFGFSFAPAAGSLGQQAAGGGPPLWGPPPANPQRSPVPQSAFNVGPGSAPVAPAWALPLRSATPGAGSSAAPAAPGPLAAALAAAVALPPAPAAPRQAVAGEAWPLQQVAFTMGWYERSAPRTRRCRPRGERRQSIRARVRA